jgi:hypothetical protein
MDPFLQSRLLRIARRESQRRLVGRLALTWLGGALLAWAAVLLHRSGGGAFRLTLPSLAAVATALSVYWAIRAANEKPDYRRLAERIERRFPDLKGLLLTAVQPPAEAAAESSYLRSRLVEAAVRHCQEQEWIKLEPRGRLMTGTVLQLVAFALFCAGLVEVHRLAPLSVAPVVRVTAEGVTVSPGDTEIERGESLVVLASFGSRVPAGVTLVVQEPNAPARTVSLVRNLSDPVFGGTVSEVTASFTYHVVHGGERSRDFQVRVFEHPKLERVDATLTYPSYTGQSVRRIEDTRRISAVEGTRLDLALQLNKPVTSARLIARNANKDVVPLTLEPGQAQGRLAGQVLRQSQTYDLELVDADGRKNRPAAPLVIDVQLNRRPEIRVVSPRGDIRPSALEEVRFEGTVWDDFGSPRYGLAYSQAGAEPREIELGQDVKARVRQGYLHVLRLEELGVKPDELVSWFAWAEDIGPDGQVRRTQSDLYFAEVRPFDEIFREDSGMGEGEPEAGEQQQGGSQRLAELQKQIIAATWKLRREPERTTAADDTRVVRDSQVEALNQARATAERVTAPRAAALWDDVTSAMEKAASHLNDAVDTPAALAEALTAEQTALQALLKLQQRETSVTRSRSRSRGQGGGQANQRQVDQLDLAQTENRYETRRDAQAPATNERREQLQVMNRLQELAQRQQEVNERLKELQSALQEAKTEQEREEVRRELKRLQEEQREMLADVDELQQRMDRPENQSRLAEERQKLDETRQDVQRAADATAEGSIAQAVASGTRAQRQLQQMRDELRKESSSEFEEELRDLRGQARDVAQNQQQLGERLGQMEEPRRKSLGETPGREELGRDLADQQKRVQQLMERTTQLSSQAETSEPLVSRELYDSLRKVNQDDASASKALQRGLMESGNMTRSLYDRLQADAGEEGTRLFDLSSELLKEGLVPQARDAERQARSTVDELRRGVERAAERVLGDDAEALRRAQSDLQTLTDQLDREAAQAQAAAAGTPGSGQRPGEAAGQDSQPDPAEQTAQSTQRGQASQPGQRGQPDSSGQEGQTGQPGQPAQPGQAGQTAQAGQPGQPGQPRESAQPGQSARPGQAGEGARQPGRAERSGQAGTGARGEIDLEALLPPAEPGATRSPGSRGGAGGYGGPLTGDDFAEWAERLRDVEDVLDQPELRDAVAGARERARLFRQEYRRDLKKPDWAVVKAEILHPLVEVKAKIGTELARRQANDPLAPVDRDPVPARFAEPVRKYYETLGKEP